MQIVKLTSEEQEFVQMNNGLKMYLNNLAHGRAETPRSWLYEDVAADKVLRQWLTQLETVKKFEFGELVYQFDTSQLKKWGPQGKVPPISEIMDIVTRGFSKPSKPSAFSTREWQLAKEEAARLLLRENGIWHTLQPRGLEAVIDDMSARDTLDSNSGWPFFTKRKKEEILAASIEAVKTNAYLRYPAIALFRNYNQKTRLVWMYPMATNMKEGTFTQPLKERLMATGFKFLSPWRGYEHVKLNLTEAFEAGKVIAASDFEGTDEHFNKYVVLEVFDVIKHAFQEQYWDDLKTSMSIINSIPLVIGGDQKIVGWHGVSSGSNWTNDVETYFDFILAQYLRIKYPGRYSAGMAIGDDMSHTLEGEWKDFTSVLETIGTTVGQVIKAEKTTNEKNWVKFLQRLTIRGVYSENLLNGKRVLRGIYPTIRALNSSLMPEKFHKPKDWSKDMFAVRQFMILENTVDHYLFVDFVRFVVKGHPYLRRFAKKQAREIDEIQAKAKLLPGLNPTYNQEKRDSKMSTFRSIAIAKEM